MGFPYGDSKYGYGLYSRRPDWWRQKDCLNDQWSTVTCDRSGWERYPHVEHHWAKSRRGKTLAGGVNGR